MPFNWEEVSRDSAEYELCRLEVSVVAMAAGGAMGGLATAGIGVPLAMSLGGVIGLGAGYLACPYLPGFLKKKLMEGTELTHAETKSAIEAMHRYTGISDAKKSMQLLAEVRPSLAKASQGSVPESSLVKLAGATVNRTG